MAVNRNCRRYLLGFLVVLLTCGFAASAFAADDPYWDKGRAQSTYLGQTNYGASTFVIAAHAFYVNPGGWGRERIRVWGRNETVRNIYKSSLGYEVGGVARADLRFYVDSNPASPNYESRFDCLQVTGTSPGVSAPVASFPSVLYDLLGYLRLKPPGNTIDAIVAGLQASRALSQPVGSDSKLTINAGGLSAFPEAKSSLPNSVSYLDADGSDTDSESGISVKFTYNLHPMHTNFKVWPQGQVAYIIFYGGGFWFASSGAAGVVHTVNTQ